LDAQKGKDVLEMPETVRARKGVCNEYQYGVSQIRVQALR
jgi:hypothetical protein